MTHRPEPADRPRPRRTLPPTTRRTPLGQGDVVNRLVPDEAIAPPRSFEAYGEDPINRLLNRAQNIPPCPTCGADPKPQDITIGGVPRRVFTPCQHQLDATASREALDIARQDLARREKEHGSWLPPKRFGDITLADLKEHDPATDDYQGSKYGLLIARHYLDNWDELLALGAGMFLHGGPGTGKCLGVDTPVMMFDGTVKPVQGVNAGDLLMGPDSRPRRVLTTAVGHGQLYRIQPVKGDAWVCNDVHILTLRNGTTGEVFDVSLDEYLANPNSRRHRKAKLMRSAVEFPAVSVGLDPYTLGAWLGDGSIRMPTIYNEDDEIIDYLVAIAPRYGIEAKVVDDGRCRRVDLTGTHGNKHNPIRNDLMACVIDGGKRIPRQYLVNDRKTRLELLAGIIDTDGYLTSNCYEIVTMYDGLRDDLLALARGLGLAAYAKRKLGKIKATGFEGRYWKVMISGDIDMVPCKVERRKAAPRRQRKNALVTGFTATAIGNGDFYGFTLDGDGRFLLGDFTVTHNTMLTAAIANELRARGVYTVWTKIKSLYDKLLVLDKREYILAAVETADLLVLDELVSEKDTPAMLREVMRLADVRYEAGKPTIFTSNFTLDLVSGHIDAVLSREVGEDMAGVMVQRFLSRLVLPRYRTIRFAGPDMRLRLATSWGPELPEEAE